MKQMKLANQETLTTLKALQALLSALLPMALVMLATAGCVTSGTDNKNVAAATVAPTDDESPETMVVTPVETGVEPEEWQSTLTEDLESVEKLGQIFLDSSFGLYDKLLKEDITEKDTDAARSAVEDCRGKYNELVTAIEKLKTNLSRAEVQEALPLKIEGNKEELDGLLKALSVYAPAQFNRDEYTVGEGKYLTAMMFPGLAEDLPEYMASLPKANRDALLLLDHLKRISGDLSNLSSTLTAWIYDSASFDADSFVH